MIRNISEIRLINNPYAHCFKEGNMATTGRVEVEHVIFSGQLSANMRASTKKVGVLLSHFDNINKGNTLADFNSTRFKQMLTDNHPEPATKGNIKGDLRLEHKFGFCKTFKKITKNLGFQLTMKTNDIQKVFSQQ